MSDVAGELGATWHAVNGAVVAYGAALLDADTARVGTVAALGVDEVLFARQGPWRTSAWSTSIVDVAGGQLLDVIEGRSSHGLCAWLAGMPASWRDGICWAVLDRSGPWRIAFNRVLPFAVQVADPFHLVKLANERLDEKGRSKLLGLLTAGDPHGDEEPPCPGATPSIDVITTAARKASRMLPGHPRLG